MSFIDASLATLQPAPVFPELYESLWLYSGSSASVTPGGVAGSYFLQKGSTSFPTSTSSSSTKLFTVNSSTPPTTSYALEVSLLNSTSGDTAYAALWDCTSNSIVSSSQVSATSTVMTIVRSGKFTLTSGHVYGITVWSNGGTVNLTDASLIVFPSSPLTSPSVSAISLANPSGNTLKEAYIPLWVYSSGTVANNVLAMGQALLQKGSTTTTSTVGSTTKLLTLSSTWLSSQKFAFETSVYATSPDTVYAALWDMTSNSAVSSSQVSTTSTTSLLIRSSSFTLTPGHSYGVAIWSANQSGDAHLTKAHLVALA